MGAPLDRLVGLWHGFVAKVQAILLGRPLAARLQEFAHPQPRLVEEGAVRIGQREDANEGHGADAAVGSFRVLTLMARALAIVEYLCVCVCGAY